MISDKFLCIATFMVAVALYSLIGSSVPSPELTTPLAIEGVYVEKSGYVIMMRPSMQYEVCDKSECIIGKWNRNIIERDGTISEYQSEEINAVLENLFRTPLGARLELDTVFDQNNYARWRSNLENFSQKRPYTDVLNLRMGRPLATRYHMVIFVVPSAQNPGMIEMDFGSDAKESDEVTFKYASF
jgi:hypothetical protein